MEKTTEFAVVVECHGRAPAHHELVAQFVDDVVGLDDVDWETGNVPMTKALAQRIADKMGDDWDARSVQAVLESSSISAVPE